MSVKISSLNTASTIDSGDDISIAGNNPLTFSDWGSGWFMQDGTYIRSLNQKSIWLGDGVLASQGGLSVGYGGILPTAGYGIIAGSVGIGTTSPNEKLTVNGKIYANPYHPAVISGGGSPYYGANITLASDIGATAGAVRIWSRYDGSGYAAMSFERATNSQSYGQDPQLLTYAESMRISGAGSILIGTTTDAGYKLYVNGGQYGTYLRGGDMGTGSDVVRMVKSDNSTAMLVRGDGNIGINTTAPQKILDVVSGANNFVTVGADGLGVGQWAGIHFGYRENNTLYRKSAIVFERTDNAGGGGNAAGKVYILNGPGIGAGSATLADAKLTIDEYGNIGIGTTTPTGKLEIRGNRSASKDLLLNLSKFDYGATNFYQNYSNTFYTNGKSLEIEVEALPLLQLAVNNAGSAGKVIFPNGNVGIGTTSPSYKLVVNKTSIGVPAIMIGGAYYGGPRFQTYGLDADADAWMGLGADMGVGSYEHSIYYPAYSGVGKLSFGTYNGTTYSTKMLLNGSGNLLIGTTTDAGYKLDVNGNTNITGNLFFNNNSTLQAARRYVSTATLSNAGYTVIGTVTGDALASSIRISLQGTTGGTVINVLADILVNHFQDILITSYAGIYTSLTLRVVSDGNAIYSIEAITNSPNACTTYVEIFPLNSETVVFGGSAQTAISLVHPCTPGINVSATGGSNGNLAVKGDVGIGTTSPAYNLDVNGVGRFTNGVIIGSTQAQYAISGGNTYLDYAGTLNIRYNFGAVQALALNSSGEATFSSSVTATDFYTAGWFRNSAANKGLYNSAYNTYLYSRAAGVWSIASSNSSLGYLELWYKYYDEAGAAIKGSLAWDSAGFGLLNDQQSEYSVLCNQGGSYGGTLRGNWSSTGTFTATQYYTGGWFRNNSNNTGLYNETNSNHFYSSSTTTWKITSSTTTSGQLAFYASGGATYKGSVYWDDEGFGLLNNTGGWGVKLNQGASLGGTLSGNWLVGGNLLGNVRITGGDLYLNYNRTTTYSIITHRSSERTTAGEEWYSGMIWDSLVSMSAYKIEFSDATTLLLYEDGGLYLNGQVLSQYIATANYITVDNFGLYNSITGSYLRTNLSTSNYGSWDVTGAKGGYNGFVYNVTNLPHFMFDTTAGNGGLYYQTGSRWILYYNYGNNCLGIGGTTTNAFYKMYVTGASYFAGTIQTNSLTTGTVYSNSGQLTNTNPSDIRLKEDINPLQYGLKEVMALNPVTYKWKDGSNSGQRSTGLIAQDVQEIMPEYVKNITEDSEYLGLDSYAINIVLINAIKELKAEIEILKNK